MTRSAERALRFEIRRASDITRASITVASSSHCLQAFSHDERGVLGTVVSELGTNILKYAGRGWIRVETLERDGNPGVRVSASDSGPGIKDLAAALRHGFSTGGTLGLGLPAVRRLMDTLEVHCPDGGGTQVEAVRWSRHSVAGTAPPRLPSP